MFRTRAVIISTFSFFFLIFQVREGPTSFRPNTLGKLVLRNRLIFMNTSTLFRKQAYSVQIQRINGMEDLNYWERLKALNLHSLQKRRERKFFKTSPSHSQENFHYHVQ